LLRHERGISQTVVARALGLSQSYYSRLECALVEPTDEELATIARVLGVEPSARLRDVVTAAPEPEGIQA
jgi:transcriptional regulator with XRE-family HTH domain